GAGQVQSPAARYVQYRARLEGDGARLSEATLAYLPQNLRARVTEFTASDGSASGGTPPVAGTAVTRAHAPVLKLRWPVENLDCDELNYRVDFRDETESVWRS